MSGSGMTLLLHDAHVLQKALKSLHAKQAVGCRLHVLLKAQSWDWLQPVINNSLFCGFYCDGIPCLHVNQ